jgi:hypothetical protein
MRLDTSSWVGLQLIITGILAIPKTLTFGFGFTILKAIEEFGFDSMGFEKEDFLKPGIIFQFGREPKRIDLIMDLSGLDFEECYARREIIGVSGVAIDFISLTDLIESKHRAGRPQDLADADVLSKLDAEIKKVEAGLINPPNYKKRKK